MTTVDIFLALKFEMMISFIIFLLLFLKIRSNQASHAQIIGIVNGLLLLTTLFFWFTPNDSLLFNDMFKTNTLIHFQKTLLTLGLLIVSGISYKWLHKNANLIEFYLLLLSALLGMFFMISSANLLMFYLGLELATIPLAAAANFDLEKRKSSEAAMKLILSSAFSTALLLMGISFLYGTTGTILFSELSVSIVETPLSIFAFLLIFAGFAFKISVVPFHLWTADVYEGAPVPVTAFLSVVSKSAVSFVFISVLYTVFQSMALAWTIAISLLAFLSISIGNLFALRQQNLKRFLAFSAIAQVGYILVALTGNQAVAQSSVIYFLFIYMFSNLAAFGVVGIISEQTGKENIEDYKGFYQTNKFLAWVLAIALFSLAGVPPTAGFFGKFFLLMAGASKGNYVLLILAALNMVVSFYYYLRVVKVMFMDSNLHPIPKTEGGLYPTITLWICLAGMVILGLYGPIYEYIAHIVTL
ncbi:MAG: NADH-quinone oxidoreductase subunit N [Bacteroidetes bacterium B1(2017)]|nr:MAG: NADH-quinone oxidoreductase subunit N [Bacteroidetes bacterium B1(2017)]